MPYGSLSALPKAELHCHLDGVLDPDMAQAIQQERPEFPIDVDAFRRAYPIERGMQNFFQWFGLVDRAESELEYFCWIAGQHIERLKAQNVRYAEWMLPAGTFGLRRGAQQALERTAVLRQYVDERENGQIQIEFVVGMGRNGAPEAFEYLLPALLALYEKGLICGAALAGPEIDHPVKPFARFFDQLHEAGLGIEIHAGEWRGPESVWDALQHGHPRRIGHGVSLFSDPKLAAFFQESQMHIEMCPTSNWYTGSVERIEEHPIAQALALGMNFSINTDDPGAFLCSMDSEYGLLAEKFGFQGPDFEHIYRNTLSARFQPDFHVIN